MSAQPIVQWFLEQDEAGQAAIALRLHGFQKAALDGLISQSASPALALAVAETDYDRKAKGQPPLGVRYRADKDPFLAEGEGRGIRKTRALVELAGRVYESFDLSRSQTYHEAGANLSRRLEARFAALGDAENVAYYGAKRTGHELSLEVLRTAAALELPLLALLEEEAV